MRWALISVLLLALILVPFFLFEDFFNTLAARFASGEGSSWYAAVGIGGLLASDVVLPIPSSIVSAAAGVLLGFAGGTAVIWAGMTMSCGIGYWIGARSAGAARRFVGERGLARAAAIAQRYGSFAVVLCRPIPVLAEASTVFAGLVHAPRQPFFWACALSNLGVAMAYAAVGAFSMRVESFLIAFAGALALPAIGFLAARLWLRPPS
ncbi:MAG: VTT domain-containing protein [Acidobacteriota bacterium]